MSKHKTIKDIILEQERDIELEKERDMVTNPKHYNTERLNVLMLSTPATSEEFIDTYEAIFKYRWRFRYKNGTEDLKKAEWYEKKLLELLDKIEYYR